MINNIQYITFKNGNYVLLFNRKDILSFPVHGSHLLVYIKLYVLQ